MITKKMTYLLVSLLIAMGVSSCSNHDFDPNDYVSSWLSGDYEKNGLWKLYVTENGEPLSDYGKVRFDSQMLKEANIRFVKVIPGVSSKEFKNVPLVDTDDGITFEIEYNEKGKNMVIKGTVRSGEMTVDIRN